MALRVSNYVPARAYEEMRGTATQINRQVAQRASAWAGAGASSIDIISAIDTAVSQKARLQSLASTPGLALYAQDQENDPGYDVVAEYQALIAAIDTLIAEMVAVIPTSNPGGYAEVYTLNQSGSKTPRTFTPAEMSGVVAALNAVDAAIA